MKNNLLTKRIKTIKQLQIHQFFSGQIKANDLVILYFPYLVIVILSVDVYNAR